MMITCKVHGCFASIHGGTKSVHIQLAKERGWKPMPQGGWRCPVHAKGGDEQSKQRKKASG